MDNIAHIFVDEYGTPALNIEKQGTSSHFIYTAIVINATNIDSARSVHKNIIDKYFQGTHIKSKNIEHNTRVKIIKELAQLEHYVISLIVDKSQIDSKGLLYKRSFIKFFHKIFTKSFISKYKEFHIYVDETGTPEFQQSLKDYMLLNTIQLELFQNKSFNIKEDIKEEPLLQLADFYCGCMGQYYCLSHFRNQSIAIHNLIKARIFVEFFPKEYSSLFGAESFYNESFNKEIYKIAIESGEDFSNRTNDAVGNELVSLLVTRKQMCSDFGN